MANVSPLSLRSVDGGPGNHFHLTYQRPVSFAEGAAFADGLLFTAPKMPFSLAITIYSIHGFISKQVVDNSDATVLVNGMDKNASALGLKCLRKYGREFYQEIQAKRKSRKGAPRKPAGQLSASGLAKRKARGLPVVDPPAPPPPLPKGYYY